MILLLLACGAAADSAAPGACDRQPSLTYANWGQGYLERYCNGCHSAHIATDQRNGAPTGVDFDDYEGVLRYSDRILARSLDGTMPPGGGPTEAELTMLQEWSACALAHDQARWEAE